MTTPAKNNPAKPELDYADIAHLQAQFEAEQRARALAQADAIHGKVKKTP